MFELLFCEACKRLGCRIWGVGLLGYFSRQARTMECNVQPSCGIELCKSRLTELAHESLDARSSPFLTTEHHVWQAF